MALNKGIWDPKLRGTNIKGTNLKSLKCRYELWTGSRRATSLGLNASCARGTPFENQRALKGFPNHWLVQDSDSGIASLFQIHGLRG